MAKAKPGHRLVLQLDPRVVLEEIILNRHERIPVTRRQEWLRGLLVQGFRSECQTLRTTSENATRRPIKAFKNTMAGGTQNAAGRSAPKPVVVKGAPSTHAARKPFAALSKVIG